MKIKRNKIIGLLTLLTLVILYNSISPVSAASLSVYDDDPAFWTIGAGGSGGISISISNEPIEVYSGTFSTKYNVSSGSFGYVNIQHSYSTPQDWSAYDKLTFYWYGQNTDAVFRLHLQSPDSGNRFTYSFVDNFVGWQKITIWLEDFTETGSPNWNNIRGIQIARDGITTGVWYIDNLSVETETYTLGLYTEGRGTILVNSSGPYEEGAVVQITADPDSGWAFKEWNDAVTGVSNPETIKMTSNKIVTAVFTDTIPIIVSTPASSYDKNTLMIVQIRQGTTNGEAMLQVNLGTTVVWADQVNLDSLGNLDYIIKIPATWANGVYTIQVKDIEGESIDDTTVTIPIPSPPPSGPPGGGGGGGVALIIPPPAVIALLGPEDAADLLEDFKAKDVAEVLDQVADKTHVTKIIEYFDPTYAAQVLSYLPVSYSGQALLDMARESAVEIIMAFDASHSDILKSLLGLDPGLGAVLVEDAVKGLTEGLSSEDRVEVLRQLGGAIELLDVGMIIDLLVGIAGLPETPATAALILESISLSKAIDITSFWINSEIYQINIPKLVIIIDNLSEKMLDLLYRGLSNDDRANILPNLLVTTITRLPEIGIFEASNLLIEPNVVEPGQMVTISYTIENVGNETDDFVIPLRINGVTETTETGVMATGESIEFSFTTQKNIEGEYLVEILSAEASFTVEEEEIIIPPTPADLRVTDLEITPEQAFEGEKILILVTVRNFGEESGSNVFELYVDGVLVEEESLTLIGGQENTILYEIYADYSAGIHTISVDELSSDLEVLSRPTKIPWLTILTALVALVGIAGFVLNRRYNFIEL